MTAKISFRGFFAITAAMIVTVFNFPAFATAGLTLVFFLIFSAICFFIPIALISAELATIDDWGEKGVYGWCSMAFGKRWGFFAIFLEWIPITIALIAVIYFLIGSLSYFLNMPIINSNYIYKYIILLMIFWGLTLLSLKGAAFVEKFALVSIIVGIIIPIALLGLFTVIYVIQGQPTYIHFSMHKLIPNLTNIHTVSILVVFVLAFMGIEASAIHVSKLHNAKRNYPIIIMLVVIFTLLVDISGSLPIAMVIPSKQIDMSSGIMQAFFVFLHQFHIVWVGHIISLFLAIGAASMVFGWILGPVHGLYITAMDNIIPAKFKKINKHGIPVNLVLFQGVVLTLWATLITFIGGGKNISFLFAITLAALSFLAMYTLLFISYIRIKFKFSNTPRGYFVPGGKTGGVIIATIGFCSSVLALIISFVPPLQIGANKYTEYFLFLSGAFIVVVLIPHIYFSCRTSR